MSHPTEASTDARPAASTRADGWRLVQKAPGPETPDAPDRDGRRKGMALILGGGAAFWGAVGAVAWYLVNR